MCAAPPSRALTISDRSGGSALLFAARAATSFANGLGNGSDGRFLRVDASPVSGLIVGCSITHCAAIAFTSARSEEHTSELQSLMRISYAVFCLKKKNHKQTHIMLSKLKRYG